MSSENSCASSVSNVEKCSLVLVDVAGTTTSINFVKNTLFPFVSKNAEAFLKSQWEEASLKESLKKLQEAEAELDLAAATELVKSLTEKNSEVKELKEIQGLIYKKGYEDGEIKGHVFPDVAEAFESWASSRKVAIYSSGSIESQKLLFAHTEAGDLSAHISHYFDLSVGDKTEAASYKKIAEEVKITDLDEIVFISDDSNEVKAAKSAGMAAFLIQREETSTNEADAKDLTVIKSFKDLTFENASKRKNEDPVDTEVPPAKILKTDETATEEAKPTEEKKEEIKEPEKMEVEETKKTEETIKNTGDKKETDGETTPVTSEPEKTEEKAEAIEPEEKKPETEMETDQEATKPPGEQTVKDETKKTEEVAEKEDKPAADEKVEKAAESVENGAPSAANEEEPAKAEEKENKSVLANGVENGEKGESAAENNGTEASAETVESESDVTKADDSEVKVKKIEEAAEISKAVSVEV